MTITVEQLRQLCPKAPKNVDVFVPYLNIAMSMYCIDTPQRTAMFLAQLAHESGQFRYVREIWGPTEAQKRYEGRKDLGNIVPGDGSKYRGRGLIQITGRANYAALSKDFPPDFLRLPELLETPRWACISAGWFWNKNKINELVDTGSLIAVTRKINGGTNGLADRQELYNRALKIFK